MVPRSLRTLPAAAGLGALTLLGSAHLTPHAFAAPLESPAGITLSAPLDASSVPTTAAATTAAPSLDVAAAEAQFVDLLNADRTANGLPPLQIDPRLMDVARWRSEDMVARNYFSHMFDDGVVSRVLKDRQITFRLAGENLAEATFDDSRTVPAVESSLMNSPGHRVNILRPEFNYVGVGIAVGPNGRVVFTQIFTWA
jgi:uncharacterized protein YkwD